MRKYNTDKYDHGFIDIYEPYFHNMKEVNHVLEIGVYDGESLKYLSSQFEYAIIHGIDIENKTQYNNEKIRTYIVNQENRNDLEKFLNEIDFEFDIIIDDGGHTMKQQQTSFGVLFKKVKNGGIYILEDLHTSRLRSYIVNQEDLITSLDMLYTIQYTKNVISNHMTDEEKQYIKNNVKNIEIWSKNKECNQSVTSIIQKK